MKRRFILTTVGAILLCGLAAPPGLHAATARLRGMVAVGDSLLAGFASGGFAAGGQAGQRWSIPAYVARRAGVRLSQPLMAAPGVPPPLRIVDENRNGALDPGEVRRTSDGIGYRARPIRQARNLAVPGEDLTSVVEPISSATVARRLVSGADVDGRDVVKFLVLALPVRDDAVSQVSRAQALDPGFIILWLGNNDVLDMATSTDPEAVGLTAEQFGRRFRRVLNELAETGAAMAVANLPDVAGIAALRPAAGEVTSCRQADGTLRPVASDDLLSIDLERTQLPIPGCTRVLGPAERARIRGTVQAFNAEIAGAIADTERTRGIAIAAVDVFTFFDDARTRGLDLDGDGGPDLDAGYLGGLFSLDGIHPTRTGSALVANVFIDAINRRFAEAIPAVDVGRVAERDPLVGNGFRPAGPAPFGVIDDTEVDDLTGFFDRTSDTVAQRARGIGRRERDRAEDLLDRFRRFLRDLPFAAPAQHTRGDET